MTTKRKSRRIQENGQDALQAGVKRQSGPKNGQLAAATATIQGTPGTAPGVEALQALAEIGEALKEQGISLEEMIERGRAIRSQLLEEQYGLRPDAEIPAGLCR